jgi:ankyrin repeat protein
VKQKKELQLVMKSSQEFQNFLHSILQGNQNEFARLLSQVDLTQDDEQGISALHYAAEAGNLPALDAILATHKIDINKMTLQSGSTALMQAAMRGHLAAVSKLLEAGADARITSRTGYSALMMAVEAGSLDCTKSLLHCPIDLNTLNSNGQNICNLAVKSPEILALILQTGQVHKSSPEASPLHSAVLSKESARLLLDYGFDVDFMDNSGDTPLGSAVKHQNLQVAEFLIENGADLMLVSKHRESIFELAALWDESEEFLRKYTCPAQFLSSVIVACASKNRLKLIKALAKTEEIEEAASDAFVSASQHGARESVLLFLPLVIEDAETLFTGAQSAIASGFMVIFAEIFAFVSKSASKEVLQSLQQSLPYLLLTAAENDKVEAANFLLEQGVPVDGDGSEGCTPLIAASASGSFEVVRALLRRGAAVDAEHEHGGTALLLAATNGHLEIVRELLSHGADHSIKDSSGFTPLLAATLYNRIEIVNLLLSKPLQEMNYSSNEGCSPLLAAASTGDDAVAEKFLILGAELKQCDDQGNTALHIAAQKGHAKTISFLMRKGFGVDAFCSIKNTKNYTPMQILINDGRANLIAKLLEEFTEMKSKVQAPKMQAIEPDHLCLICRDEMEDEALVLPCRHEFHFHCFGEWSKLHPKCPTCKRFPYKSI